jgi:hypothetical protein
MLLRGGVLLLAVAAALSAPARRKMCRAQCVANHNCDRKEKPGFGLAETGFSLSSFFFAGLSSLRFCLLPFSQPGQRPG